MITVVRTAVLLALTALVIVDPRVMVVAKYLLNQYAFGESSLKVVLLLLFLTVLSAARPLPSLWNEDWNRKFAAGLGFLYAMTLAEYLFYCGRFGLQLSERSILFAEGSFSTTRLPHIHNAKAILSVFLPYRGQGFDGGTPFLAVYDRPVLILHGVLFLMACLATVVMVHHYSRRWTPERSLFLALAMFPLLKGVVDGGPLLLDNSARLGLMALVLLNGRQRNLTFGGCGALFFAALFLEAHKGLFYNLVTAGVAVVGLLLPLTFERARKHRSLASGVGFLVLVLLFLATPIWKHQNYSYYRKTTLAPAAWLYGNSKLEKGWTVHIVSGRELPETEIGQTVGVVQANRLRITQLTLARDTTVFELCKRFRLNVLRSPVSWYNEPGYAVIEGPIDWPSPSQWLSGGCVSGYQLIRSSEQSTLILELIPGAQVAVVADLLPVGPFAARRFDWTYTRPDSSTEWIRP